VPRLFEFSVDRVGYALPSFAQLAVVEHTTHSVPVYGSFSVNLFANATYPSGTRTRATPYLYFRAAATGDYVTLYDVRPYYDTRTARWVEPERFQIISAGLDGGFGLVLASTPSPYGAYYPAGENFAEDAGGGLHTDNITNFTVNGTIRDDMP